MTRADGGRQLQMRLNAGAHEFVKMDHAIFHRRLVWAEFIAMLLVKRTATFRHAHADFFIFPGSLATSSAHISRRWKTA